MKKTLIGIAALMISAQMAFAGQATNDFSIEPPGSMAGTAMPNDTQVTPLHKEGPVVETFKAPDLQSGGMNREQIRIWEKNNGGVGEY